MNLQDCCVLIPSLEPDEKLPLYVKELLSEAFGLILVIDDGSSAAYQPIFDEIDTWARCKVLHHEHNRGKGAALRTGFAYILNETSLGGVVTADSDGQHTVPDTRRLAEQIDETGEEVLLGSRDFSLRSKQVPPKSRMGNRITSTIYYLLYGKWLPDTQTGLRAMGRSLLPWCLEVKGDRFEYEMNQLIECSGKHIKTRVVPIKTVYLNENQGTHFHPIKDSWRIYKLLLTSFLKFMSASLMATLIDLGLFTILNRYVLVHIMPNSSFEFLGQTLFMHFWIATIVARVCSATVNFKLNKAFVFNLKKCKGATLRYIALCVPVMLVSGCSVSFLSAVLNVPNASFFNTLIKAVVDGILFLVNFRLQKAWVFNAKNDVKQQGVSAE